MSQSYRKKRYTDYGSDENSEKRGRYDSKKKTNRRSSSSSQSKSTSSERRHKDSSVSRERNSSNSRYNKHSSKYTNQKLRSDVTRTSYDHKYDEKYYDDKYKYQDKPKYKYDEQYEAKASKYDSRYEVADKYARYEKYDSKYDPRFEKYPPGRYYEDKYAYYSKPRYNEYERFEYGARPVAYNKFYTESRGYRGSRGFRRGYGVNHFKRDFPYRRHQEDTKGEVGGEKIEKDDRLKKLPSDLAEEIEKVSGDHVPAFLRKPFNSNHGGKFKNIRYIPKKPGGTKEEGGDKNETETYDYDNYDRKNIDEYNTHPETFENDVDIREGNRMHNKNNNADDEKVPIIEQLEVGGHSRSPSISSSSATQMDNDEYYQEPQQSFNTNLTKQIATDTKRNENTNNTVISPFSNRFTHPLTHPEYFTIVVDASKPYSPLFRRPEFCQNNINYSVPNDHMLGNDSVGFNVKNNYYKQDSADAKFDLRMKLSSNKTVSTDTVQVPQYQSVRRVVEADKRTDNNERFIFT